MRHVIFGGDGFVGRHLAPKLIADGHEVIVADISHSDLPHYRTAKFVSTDVTDLASVERLGLRADDMIYNLSAKMLCAPGATTSSGRSTSTAPKTLSPRWTRQVHRDWCISRPT
jgi:nucleoside-diphosphate-sugar epimerase